MGTTYIQFDSTRLFHSESYKKCSPVKHLDNQGKVYGDLEILFNPKEVLTTS